MLYKILVVDDEEPVRELFDELFRKEDCQTVSCATGEDALKILKKETFDVVLLDIKLPGMSGLEVLKNIREFNKDLPVVMITGFGFDEDLIAKTKQFGCSGYIGKNMPVVQIITTFKQFVKKALEKRKNP